MTRRQRVASSGMRDTVTANKERKIKASDVRVGATVEWFTPEHPRIRIWKVWSAAPGGRTWLIWYPDGYDPADPDSPRPITVDAPTGQLLRPARGAGAQ